MENLTFPGPVGPLSGVVHRSDGATRAAIVCHPHPEYGGTMDNPVVVAVFDALAQTTTTVLRFNFSTVEGAVDDLRAAIEFLRRETGFAVVSLAGYSFGAMAALTAGIGHQGVDAIAAIALPVPMFTPPSNEVSEQPILLLTGDSDQFSSVADAEGLTSAFGAKSQLEILPDADHFLGGFEERVGAIVLEFLRPSR